MKNTCNVHKQNIYCKHGDWCVRGWGKYEWGLGSGIMKQIKHVNVFFLQFVTNKHNILIIFLSINKIFFKSFYQ